MKNVWLLGGIALGGSMVFALILTLLGVRFFGARFQRYVPEPDQTPAHERANSRLEELREYPFDSREAMAAFYFQLTEIIKEYVENRYGFGATAETSTELLQELEKRQPDGIPLAELRTLLGQADLVKYAAFGGTSGEALSAIEQCREMVNASRKSEAQLSQEREERKAIRLEDAPFRLRAAGASLDCGLASLAGAVLTLLVSPEFGWTLGGMAGAALAGLWMGLRGAWIPPVGRRWMGLAVVFENGSIPPKRTLIVRNLLLLLPYVGWMSSLVWARLDPAGRRPAIGGRERALNAPMIPKSARSLPVFLDSP